MMALSRFTPWFAVSALMPLGCSSTHSFHLDFENINVMLRLSYSFSFEVHAYIYSTNNACLFAAPSMLCSVRDIGKSMQLVYYLQIRRISVTKGEI